MSMRDHRGMNRRAFLHAGALGAGCSVLGAGACALRRAGLETHRAPASPFVHLEEATLDSLQRAMNAGELTAHGLVEMYLERIEALDRSADGPRLRAVLETNPDALATARALDEERRRAGPRSRLHGIPVLVKDNIATADAMETTAGSLALLGAKPAEDATVARKLREAGALLLGKTNMSEWANFRSYQSSSGWSARGGQGRCPYALDRNPSGSSSGSAQAVAANLAAVALGTETDGSIVSPASTCGIVGIKPTVGLTSRYNVIPISETQDTIGPMARTVTDAAILLGVLAGVDPRDAKTAACKGKAAADYTRFLHADGLRGARLGVPRKLWGFSPEGDAVAEAALRTLRELGAVLVDPADIPTVGGPDPELDVLLYEFKDGLNKYLAALPRSNVRTLADLIRFNEAHADRELRYFGQELFEQAEAKGPLTDPRYREALEQSQRLAGREGLDAILDRHRLDALVAPTEGPAVTTDLINGDRGLGGTSSFPARAGYPIVTVPAGYSFGLPVNISFLGRAFSEPTLIRLAYAFEQATTVRRPPAFLPTLDLD